MKRWWWYIVAVTLGSLGVLGYILFRRRDDGEAILAPLQAELQALEAASHVEEVRATYNAEVAKQRVEKEYAEELFIAREEDARKVERLKDDPVALARHAVRVAGKRRRLRL